MKNVNCLICGSSEHEHLATFDNDPYLKRLSDRSDYYITYVICKNCGFVFTNPMLDDAELDEMYSEKYRPAAPDEKFIQGNLRFMQDRYKWISKQIGENTGSKKILDIGCSAGTLLKIFKDNGWKTCGIEPSESFAKYGNNKFGVNITAGFYTKDSYPEQKFDLIVCLQVLEHVPNPEGILSAMKKNLADDGNLVIGVPTLLRPLRPIHPQTLASPHLYIFSPATLKNLLAKSGFDIFSFDYTHKGLIAIAKRGETNPTDAYTDDYRNILWKYEQETTPDSIYNKNIGMLATNNPSAVMTAALDVDISAYSFKKPTADILLRKEGTDISIGSYDPASKAKQVVEKIEFTDDGIIVVFGFALGDIIRELLIRAGKGYHIIVCEMDIGLFKTALYNLDLTDILKDKRVSIVLGENYDDIAKHLSIVNRKYMLTGRIHIIKHRYTKVLNAECYSRVSQLLNDRATVNIINKNTLMGLGKSMMTNTLENLHIIADMPGVNRLSDKLKGIPAVIVSAGPSLEKNFHLLKGIKNKAVIIACDTVMRLLIPNGINPDIVITADPQQSTYRKFRDLPVSSNAVMVCHPINYPDIVRTFAGKKFAVGGQTPIYKWLSKHWEEKGRIDVSSQCVAHMALNLAVLIGADPIIFIGQDLCYHERKKHAASLSKGSPFENKTDDKGFVEMSDIFGEKVSTTILFKSFKVLFEERVKKLDRTFINATEGGLPIGGMKLMSFKDAIDEYCNAEALNINEKIQAVCVENKSIPWDEIIRELNTAYSEAKEIVNLSKKILKICQKVKGNEDENMRIKLSSEAEKKTSQMKGREWFLNMFADYALELELYMSSQKIVEIDEMDDVAEKFKKQIERAKVYYSGLIKVLLPFEQGIKKAIINVTRRKELLKLEAQAHDMRSMLNIAKGYKELYMYDKAVAFLENILRDDPENIEAIYHMGDMLLNTHHSQSALSYLEKVKKQNPKYMNANKLLIQAKEKLASWEEKLKDSYMEPKSFSDADWKLYSGEFYCKIGEMDIAEKRFYDAIGINPQLLEAYLSLARFYESRNDIEKCVDIFEKALSNISDNAELYKEIGFFSLRAGDIERAGEFFDAAAAIDHNLYEFCGDAFISAGHYDSALSYYQKGLENNPNNASLLTKTAVTYNKLINANI
jgi:2-polyprenyl-3-methyl-5-hydroxy-6-metoxy-1,4-benzoquinol methylase/Tfp pilus assembly protein PilF